LGPFDHGSADSIPLLHVRAVLDFQQGKFAPNPPRLDPNQIARCFGQQPHCSDLPLNLGIASGPGCAGWLYSKNDNLGFVSMDA
jgi:hypothetical protein